MQFLQGKYLALSGSAKNLRYTVQIMDQHTLQSGIQVYSVQSDGQLVLLTSSAQDIKPYSSRAIVNFLTRRLPYSLPLLRRLQLGPHSGTTLLITTSLPLDEPSERTHSEASKISPGSLWTMAFSDREGYPSTETWLLTSLELYHGTATHEREPQPPSVEPSSLELPFRGEICKAATIQLLNVLSYVPATSRESLPSPGLKAPRSDHCLAGNVHTTTAALLAKAGVVVWPSPPYGKYLFSVPDRGAQGAATTATPADSSSGLPQGLVWGEIGPSDYSDVMAANSIVRSASTIANLTSVAIRAASPGLEGGHNKAVAFAFASGNGSIRTLHVDPAYRRQGLAKKVVSRLLSVGEFEPPRTGPLAADEDVRRSMEQPVLGYTGIEGSNVGSIKTFQAIGAKWHWDVFWLGLDLEAIARQVRGLRDG